MYGTSQVSVPLDTTLRAITKTLHALVVAQIRQQDYLTKSEVANLKQAKEALDEVLEWPV